MPVVEGPPGPPASIFKEQMRIIGDVLGRRIKFEELSPDDFRSETEGSWPRPAVDMLLAAWAATIGGPAPITSTVFDILGSPPRSFRQWVGDHARAFIENQGQPTRATELLGGRCLETPQPVASAKGSRDHNLHQCATGSD